MWNRNIAAKGSEAVCPEPDGYHPHDDDDDSNNDDVNDDDIDDDGDDDDTDDDCSNDYDDNDDSNDDDDFVGQWSVFVPVVVRVLNVSSSLEFFIKSCCYRDRVVTIQYRHHRDDNNWSSREFSFNFVSFMITVVISDYIVQSGLIT